MKFCKMIKKRKTNPTELTVSHIWANQWFWCNLRSKMMFCQISSRVSCKGIKKERKKKKHTHTSEKAQAHKITRVNTIILLECEVAGTWNRSARSAFPGDTPAGPGRSWDRWTDNLTERETPREARREQEEEESVRKKYTWTQIIHTSDVPRCRRNRIPALWS